MVCNINITFQGELYGSKFEHHQVTEGSQGFAAPKNNQTSSQAEGCVRLCRQFAEECRQYLDCLYTVPGKDLMCLQVRVSLPRIVK